MTGPDTFTTWATIVALGIGTFLIRFSFLGIIGDRQLPEWVLRHLRYTAARGVTRGVGILSRNVLLAILSGLAALYLVLFGLG